MKVDRVRERAKRYLERFVARFKPDSVPALLDMTEDSSKPWFREMLIALWQHQGLSERELRIALSDFDAALAARQR